MNVLSYGFSVFTLDCPKPASRWRFARVSIVEKILLLLQVLSYLDLAAMDNSLIKMVQMIQWAQNYKKTQPKNHKKPPKPHNHNQRNTIKKALNTALLQPTKPKSYSKFPMFFIISF